MNHSCIQGVPGGKVNILGGHSIGHSKQKTVYAYVSCFERFPNRAIPLNRSKTVNKKEILRTVSNIGIYCSSEEVGAVCLV
jgi:hypothetical protein